MDPVGILIQLQRLFQSIFIDLSTNDAYTSDVIRTAFSYFQLLRHHIEFHPASVIALDDALGTQNEAKILCRSHEPQYILQLPSAKLSHSLTAPAGENLVGVMVTVMIVMMFVMVLVMVTVVVMVMAAALIVIMAMVMMMVSVMVLMSLMTVMLRVMLQLFQHALDGMFVA